MYNEKAWKDNCLNRIAAEKGYLELLREWCHKMNTGGFKQGHDDWARVIVQRWNEEYDVFDAHCFIHVWAQIQSKQIALIPVGPLPTPGPDKHTHFNNSALAGLPNPFSAKFVGGPGEDDGYVSWDSDLIAGESFSEPIPAGKLPLEVGYTAAWTTARHCFCDGGVARWPYESERMYLLIRVQPPNLELSPELRKIFGLS